MLSVPWACLQHHPDPRSPGAGLHGALGSARPPHQLLLLPSYHLHSAPSTSGTVTTPGAPHRLHLGLSNMTVVRSQSHIRARPNFPYSQTPTQPRAVQTQRIAQPAQEHPSAEMPIVGLGLWSPQFPPCRVVRSQVVVTSLWFGALEVCAQEEEVSVHREGFAGLDFRLPQV